MPRRKPGQPPKPKPILPTAGRPYSVSKPGVPQRRLVITDLGDHAGRWLDAIRNEMAAASEDEREPPMSEVVRFALWLAGSTLLSMPKPHAESAIHNFREKGGAPR